MFYEFLFIPVIYIGLKLKLQLTWEKWFLHVELFGTGMLHWELDMWAQLIVVFVSYSFSLVLCTFPSRVPRS